MLKVEWTNRDALDCNNTTCANCQYNDGVIYTSMPPQYKCTITNEFHWNNDKCDVEFAPIKHGYWTIEDVVTYERSYGGTLYEPVYKCSCCGRTTESYVRGDEPIMPEDADFPDFCGHCGAKMDEVTDGEIQK